MSKVCVVGMFGDEKRFWKDCGNRCGVINSWVESKDDSTNLHDLETASSRIHEYIPEGTLDIVYINNIKHTDLKPDYILCELVD